jgi:copper transport protein
VRRSVLIALLVLVTLPATADAHAVLEGTTPERGSASAAPPAEVAFRFSEPVEASFGAIRVFDAEGDQVQTGEVERPGGESSAIAVSLPEDLADGSYTATFRVVSADSHPVSGGFVFGVGADGPGSASSVSELLDESDSGSVTSVAFGVIRWAGFAAIGLGAGAFVFLLAVWRPALRRPAGPEWVEAGEAFARRFRRLVGGAAALGFVAALASIVAQGAVASGTSFWSALDPGVIGEVLETRFGVVAAFRALAWLLVGLALLAPSLRANPKGSDPLTIAALAVPLAFLVAAPGLAGHPATQSPGWLLVPSDLVHVVAMSVWLGGLVLLVAAVPAVTRRLEPGERSRLLAAIIIRFSPLALAAVIALAVTGVAQSIVYIGPLDQLLDTGFGRAVLAKGLLLLVLIGFGAWHRRRSIPALRRLADGHEPPGGAGVVLRRALLAEVGVIAVVLAVTAALVSYAPPSEAEAGPASGTATLGDARLEYTVDPALAGSNEMHLYLFDAESGAQFTDFKELNASLSLPAKDIGPIEAELEKSGPGHYVAPAAPFGVPGDWEVTVDMRVSRFDQDEADLEVPIG